MTVTVNPQLAVWPSPDVAVTWTGVVPTAKLLPDAGTPVIVTGPLPPDAVALYVTGTDDPSGEATDIFAGHVTVSGGGAGGVTISTVTVISAGDPGVPAWAWTLNVFVYCPATNVEVLKVNVSVPLFTPDVGETLSHAGHPPLGGTTDHLSARLPALRTCTV